MQTYVALTVLILASAQGSRESGNPGTMLPFEAYGDLNMPGFTELNTALNSGFLDLAPSLARLPAFPTTSLTNVIAKFLGDAAEECLRRGETAMAASLATLQDVSPEMEALALEFGQLGATWGLLGALREVGLATAAQRTRLEVCAEAWELAITPQVQLLLERVHDLGSEPAVQDIQSRVHRLHQDFNMHYAAMVSDTAEMLRVSGRVASSILNHRAHTALNVQAQQEAAADFDQHLLEAALDLTAQVESLEVELQALQLAGVLSKLELLQLAMPLRQISSLSRREALAIQLVARNALRATLGAQRAMQPFL